MARSFFMLFVFVFFFFAYSVSVFGYPVVDLHSLFKRGSNVNVLHYCFLCR
jgi:hypothetical protein